MSLSHHRSRNILLQTVLLASCSIFFLTISAQAIVDINENGVSDLWEKHYNNGNLFTNFDPQADPDGDGWTNEVEAISGTDPGDGNPPTGCIRPVIAYFPAVYGTNGNGDPEIVSAEAVTITWPSLIGKQYTLLCSADLTAGSWFPIDNSTPRIGTGEEMGNGIPLTQSDGSIPASMFWRVVVEDVDTDSDGLADFEETLLGSSSTSSDSDEDGLSDFSEATIGTDPNLPDSDGDGISDSEETASGTNPNNRDTDGDSQDDGDDADPKEILIDWPSVPKSSFALVEVVAPQAIGEAVDINDKGEVLFSNGIWAAGEWIPKAAEDQEGSNASDDFTSSFTGWEYFDNSRNLVGNSEILITTGPFAYAYGFNSAASWPSGKTAVDLGASPEMTDYHYHNMKLTPLGITGANQVVTCLRYSTPTDYMREIAVFSGSGGAPTILSTPANTGLLTPQGGSTLVSPKGWIAAHAEIPVGGLGRKIVLWNPSHFNVPLPPEADAYFPSIQLTDLPEGQTALPAGKIGIVASSGSTSHVFLPDKLGNMQHVQSISGLGIQLLAPDGTGMTTDGGLWRNGKLIPLRELCPRLGEFVDEGWDLFPHKANRNGTYLIQAQGPNGEMEENLAVPIRIEGVDTTVNPANLQAPDHGVDNISIGADKTPNNGNQSDMWIMAPIDRTNTVRFISGASPTLPLHLSAENATFTPAVLDSSDQQVIVTGTGTATSESSLVVKVGEKVASCPIRVKAMKKRTVKVAVHAVGLNVVPPEIPTVPDPGVIQNYLNSVFSTQINADIVVVPGSNEVPLSWDIGRASIFQLSGPGSEKLHEGNGTFDFTGGAELEQEDKYINLTLRDENSDINVYILTRHLIGWFVQGGVVRSSSGTVGIARRTSNVIVIDGKQNNSIIPIISHEIGHCMVGYGHPDLNTDPLDVLGASPQNRGVAPHDGLGAEEWNKRLMHSSILPFPGKTMVKSEWDAAETWLKSRPRGDN